jgi:hypothetical protein
MAKNKKVLGSLSFDDRITLLEAKLREENATAMQEMTQGFQKILRDAEANDAALRAAAVQEATATAGQREFNGALGHFMAALVPVARDQYRTGSRSTEAFYEDRASKIGDEALVLTREYLRRCAEEKAAASN